MSSSEQEIMSSIVEEEHPVVREENASPRSTQEKTTESPTVEETEETETTEEKTVEEEATSAPVEESTLEQSESPMEEEIISEEPVDFDDLFPEDEQTETIAEDESHEQKPAGSDEKPNVASKPNDKAHLYDHHAAKEAKDKARALAHTVDGSKATELVEAANELVAEEVVEMDDLDWLNEEDADYTFEDLFPDMEIEEELALEDGKAPALAIQDDGAGAQEPEIQLNPFEQGLERLKKKRPAQEMTPQEAEDKMENLICKMTSAADDDSELIRKNMAKERLEKMCEKEKAQKGFLAKKEAHARFTKLYKFAQFPGAKDALKSYWVEKDGKANAAFDSTKARVGTLKLLRDFPEQPALAKLAILKPCMAEINKPTNQNWFVTFGGLSILKSWLQPNPNGSLPALTIRSEILKALQKLPVSSSNLKKSKIGHEVKALWKNPEETLSNRKICQELVQQWLSGVLEVENSIRRARNEEQHEMSQKATPVKKKRKTAAQIKAAEKESQERRHPQMFQKASHNFKVQPEYEVRSLASSATAFRQTRKGKIAKCAGELRAMRPAQKHEHVSIAGGKINLSFNN